MQNEHEPTNVEQSMLPPSYEEVLLSDINITPLYLYEHNYAVQRTEEVVELEKNKKCAFIILSCMIIITVMFITLIICIYNQKGKND